MLFVRSPIPDVLEIVPKRYEDARGFFSETFRADLMAAHGLPADFVQDNHVLTSEAGTLRGLHYQRAPKAQAKLLRCIRGRILDVAVDIRHGSPTFGRHVAVELTPENFRMLFVPVGFAHGYVTLEPDTEVLYKVTDVYSRADEGGILWNDPALGIDWGIAPDRVKLHPRDAAWPTLADAPVDFRFGA
jgi:dTDP-4-dehydrorhamnose 3,5-epimerase